MAEWRRTSAVSGTLGVAAGFTLAALVLGEPDAEGAHPVGRQTSALRGSGESMPSGATAMGGSVPLPSAVPAARVADPRQGGGAANGARTASEPWVGAALAKEVATLRERERVALEQVEAYRAQIQKLERELGAPPPRHRFDLTPDDWREMARQGAVKYRIPCGDARSLPAEQVLEGLGLSPDDADVLRKAFDNSANRISDTLLPLCVQAVGGRPDIARSLGVDGCRHVLIRGSRERGENGQESARQIASYRAGDAPLPDEQSRSLLEETFLALTEESNLFEKELAEAWGPEEAHRIVYSDKLCFTAATHLMTAPGSPAIDTR